MPPPPDSSLITRLLFENPWPAGGLALAMGLIIGWLGFRDGLTRHLRIASGLIGVGVIVFSLCFVVATAGERAVRVTRQLLAAAEKADLVTATSLFSDSSTMSFGKPENPGVDFAGIRDRLNTLSGRYAITSNTILSIRGYTESSDTGTVHLSCLTEVEAGYGPTPSLWVLRVKRQADKSWLITRITCISVAGQTGADVLR